MTITLQDYKHLGPHLERVSVVPIEGGGQFVVHGGHAYTSARYGSHHTLNIIDVSNPAQSKLVRSLKFKRAITSVAVRDDILYAAESHRALNFIRIADPKHPEYFDCTVALGKDLYDIKLVDNYVVCAMNWDGVGLIDISNPAESRFVHQIKLDVGFVERLVVANDLIFAAGALRVFAIREGRLVEVASYRENAFNASEVIEVGDRVWVVGSGEGEERGIRVIDPEKPGEIESSFVAEATCSGPLLALREGAAVGFDGYTCSAFSPKHSWSGKLFEQFERDENRTYLEIPAKSELTEAERETLDVPRSCLDDMQWVVQEGGHLIAAYGDQIVIYRVLPGSIFAPPAEK